MTLVATRKPPAHHKKHSGKHHRHSKTYHKPYWPYLPLIAVVITGLVLSNSPVLPARFAVLSYATSMNTQALLDDTNTQRINNGQAALAANAQLNAAAQAKANDMVSKDYWSHNTIDGRTPWMFVSEAGYSYQLIGENLAYGFDTASNTITGWMNSPGHRANILNAGYRDVGFGVANAPNYHALILNPNTNNWEPSYPSGGPFTIVVAMYGAAPGAPANAAAPAKSPVTAVQAAPASSSAGASTTPPAPVTTEPPAAEDSVTAPTTETTVSTNTDLKNVPEPAQQHIKRSQILTAGQAPWSGLAVALIGAGAIALFFFRHAIAWHTFIRRGEQFVLHHPLLDIVLVTAFTVAFILSRSTGVIR